MAWARKENIGTKSCSTISMASVLRVYGVQVFIAGAMMCIDDRGASKSSDFDLKGGKGEDGGILTARFPGVVPRTMGRTHGGRDEPTMVCLAVVKNIVS